MTQGKVALVDAEDYRDLSVHRWHLQNYGYAARNVRTTDGKSTLILMHREILGATRGQEVDHANGCKLDNRRSNLRLASRQDNSRNTRPHRASSSRFKGVNWDGRVSATPWRAKIQIGGKQVHLGRFSTEEDAARAYDRVAILEFGDFARPNFPQLVTA